MESLRPLGQASMSILKEKNALNHLNPSLLPVHVGILLQLNNAP